MNDSELDDLLKSCGTCETPPRFSSDVWSRIEAASTPACLPAGWRRFLVSFLAPISKPVGAFATCACFLFAGAIIGSHLDPRDSEARYIESISPFIHQTEP